MAIGKRIFEALQRAESGDFEAALIPVCIALDATAKREKPHLKVGARYKEFLRDNAWIIGYASFRIAARRVRTKLDHPNLRPDSEGYVYLEDILYHVVRCGLLHEGRSPITSNYPRQSPMAKIRRDLLSVKRLSGA